MQWYARQVANHPSLVILFIFALAGTCVIIALTTNKLPNFENPLLGFEPRGTVLSQRLTAWKNLEDNTGWINQPLTMVLRKDPDTVGMDDSYFSDKATASKQKFVSVTRGNASERQSGPWVELEEGINQIKEELPAYRERSSGRQNNYSPVGGSFFCNDPGRDYAHVIIQSVNHENLFTLPSLKSVCQIEETKLRSSVHFEELCEQTPSKSCCRSWSLANYVALLSNRSSCHDIRETDIASVFELLKSCARYYHQLKLSHDCTAGLCREVPQRCFHFNAVYNIFHYLTDIYFLSPENLHLNTSQLTYTSIFLPIAQSTAAMDYFKDLEEEKLSDGITEVVAMELGLKQTLFNECLLHDTVIGLAAGVIFLFIWMYTTSFFVTLMTIVSIALSLGVAYFFYTTVYQVEFFPFMNLLALLIAIGIGADDSLIYCKIWACAKAEKNNMTLIKLVKDTLQHSCLTMFVTSFTTAAAFLGSYVSSITAIRCFSLFAGTAVLANFLLTVSWLPASVLVAERWCSCAWCVCTPPFGFYLPHFQHISICNGLWKLHYSFTDSARVFFEKILPCLIIKPRYIWLALFTLLAVGGAVAIFYYPSLRLPDSTEFQIFHEDHPFEKYDLELKRLFWFEKVKEKDHFYKLPVTFVWGILPVDNGNYLKPVDSGSLVFDSSFNFSASASQEWLLSFCEQLLNQSFYQSTLGPLLPNCFIRTFKTWMERRCVDGISATDRSPCCNISKFPYSDSVFNLCIREAIDIFYRTPGYNYFLRRTPGPRFSVKTGTVQAIVIQYDSIYTYSNSYIHMKNFFTEVETWTQKMMKTAPEGMKNGWFISDLEFYDLQDSLSRGTILALVVAICVAFITLLITTLNLLISIYAIITVACVIFVTVGSLVILDWKLNVVESITVSIAIGLAVDFSLHYGIAYRISSQDDRESSVVHSLSRIGSPVAMAAFTTFITGALMFHSVVLAYTQIGTFLMVVMTVSWLYATFFLQSLLSVVGPQKGSLQLSYPSMNCCEVPNSAVDKTVYALSDSTLSTSSASYPTQIPSSESHELEPLTTVRAVRAEVLKHVKRKPNSRHNRQRSGSFSSALSHTRDPTSSISTVGSSRKVSLPIVSVTFHGEPSPKHVSGATSSSTIVCAEEDKELMTPSLIRSDDNSDSGSRKNIIV
ncbi:RND transporter family member dispatched [Tachypleus tridentatus]|uniref:RND transporter family member dispatched n=1 Tax=Tachypleus tridentatus TaxID=6853 RepID=UPI003FD18A26